MRYQQSTQGWGSWFGDWAKSEAVEVTIGGLVIWILYTVIRKSALNEREVTASII
jgi:hypothetical protein